MVVVIQTYLTKIAPKKNPLQSTASGILRLPHQQIIIPNILTYNPYIMKTSNPFCNLRLSSSLHQATLASKPRGHCLTKNFLASSKSNIPRPNVMGRNQCSTGTSAVPSTSCRRGMYSQKNAMTTANRIAGKSHRFCVRLLKIGGCWKIERRLVRTASRLNHCLGER